MARKKKDVKKPFETQKIVLGPDGDYPKKLPSSQGIWIRRCACTDNQGIKGYIYDLFEPTPEYEKQIENRERELKILQEMYSSARKKAIAALKKRGEIT